MYTVHIYIYIYNHWIYTLEFAWNLLKSWQLIGNFAYIAHEQVSHTYAGINNKYSFTWMCVVFPLSLFLFRSVESIRLCASDANEQLVGNICVFIQATANAKFSNKYLNEKHKYFTMYLK